MAPFRRYLQVVACDFANVHSDVIVVYKPDFRIDDLQAPTPDQIDFCTHTYFAAGVRRGLWALAGWRPVPDLRGISFKIYVSLMDAEVLTQNHINNPLQSAPYWATWRLGDREFGYASAIDGNALPAEDGEIYPPADVLYRIVNGESEFPPKRAG